MTGQERPLIGVLICLYNGDRPEWFREAIESLLGQTYPRNRTRIYLGIDGPLSEGLEEAVRTFGDKFWKVVRSPENIHLPGMLNKLIGCLGEEAYVFRMDSDDICEPERFARQVAKMEEEPGIDVLGTAILEFDRYIGWSRIRTYPLTHDELLQRMHLGLPVAHPSVCLKRSALDRIGRYDESAIFNQDVELWFRAMEMGLRFANLPDPLLRFRCNRYTLKRRSWAKSKQELRLYLEGCIRLFGYNARLLFPLLRFGSRLLPGPIVAMLYHSGIRHRLLGAPADSVAEAGAARTAKA
jgi:glycosyltransferase involved in cell wall biosynthesis